MNNMNNNILNAIACRNKLLKQLFVNAILHCTQNTKITTAMQQQTQLFKCFENKILLQVRITHHT